MAWRGGRSVKRQGIDPNDIPDGAIEARHISSVSAQSVVGVLSNTVVTSDGSLEMRVASAESAARISALGGINGNRLMDGTVANQALGGEVQMQVASSRAALGAFSVGPESANTNRQWTFPFFGLTTKDVTGALGISATDQASVYICNGSGGYSVTLPPVADSKDRVLVFKRFTTASNVTIDGNGSETIDGATTKVLAADYVSIIMVCDGDEWHIIGAYAP